MTPPSAIIRKYGVAIRRLVVFQGTLRPTGGSLRDQEHAIEARQRLEQMLYALQRVRALERRHAALEANVATWVAPPDDRTVMVLQARRGRIRKAMLFYAEAFYYFGHRATKSIQTAWSRGFKAVGVRDVRNWLIEHPEVVHRNFLWGRPQGVVLKPYRRPGDSTAHRDAGLYPNADEFIDDLLPRLPTRGVAIARVKAALKRQPSP
jgi:hypothetical protein